jgi:uroporphyrinogen decarboxylase
VSTQGILDRASAAEVRDVACRNIDVFSRGGGYIFTPVHNLQANVPPENVIAAYDAAREHG